MPLKPGLKPLNTKLKAGSPKSSASPSNAKAGSPASRLSKGPPKLAALRSPVNKSPVTKSPIARSPTSSNSASRSLRSKPNASRASKLAPLSKSPTSTKSPPSNFEAKESTVTAETAAFRSHFASLAGLSEQHFKVGTTLGTGTFGRVRLVTHPINNLENYFALKILGKAKILKLKQVEHIKQEKDILHRINHPFIVTLYAHFKDKDNLYMLMEYVIGGELFSQLRRVNRFSDETSRFYSAEIVLAFEYLHSMDIVYRDLKPENLLIDRDGHIKITDFGFAKEVPNRTYTLCGTPDYLAPEIIQSWGHSKPVDWWALGILIYEMLAGYPPFYDDSPTETYKKILAGRFTFTKFFEPKARDLITRLLEPDRTKRLGCLKNGAADIKEHAWFKTVNWDKCFHRKIKPPYVPGFRSADDTRNFEEYPDSDDDGGFLPLTSAEEELFSSF